MTYSQICESVKKVTRKYDETDPFRLYRAMGILLLFDSLGTDPDAIKGFFIENRRIRAITINSDLPQVIQRIIVAHELCHAINHRGGGVHAFHELMLFDNTSQLEKDANLFAAELLLDDQEVFEVLNQDTTFFSAASALRVPAELLDFKFRVMKWKGYKMIEPPINVRSNFLKDMEVLDNEDDYGC